MYSLHPLRHLSRFLTWTTVVGATLLIVAVNILYVYSTKSAPDFISFWSASRWLIEGRDPYSLHFLYPLWFAILLTPIGSLPFLPATVAWLTLNQTLFILTIAITIHLTRTSLSLLDRLLLVLGLGLFTPTIFTFLAQQSSLLILFLIISAGFAWQRNHPLSAGVLMALTLSKPHLSLLIVLFWLLNAIYRGEWRLFNGFIGGTVGLFIIAEIVQPGWVWSWLDVWQAMLNGGQRGTEFLIFTPVLFFCGALITALLLTLITLSVDRQTPYFLGLSLIIPLALIINYRYMTYDLVLLIVPLIGLVVSQQSILRLKLLVGSVTLSLCLTFLANYYQNGFILQSLPLWVLGAIIITNRSNLQRAVAHLFALCQKPLHYWPKNHKQALLRLMIVIGMATFGFHLAWWSEVQQMRSILLIGLLSIVLFANLVQILCIWYLYLHIASPKPRPPLPSCQVDVYVTAFNESLELIEQTLKAAVNIRYPHRTYLLDDGREAKHQALAQRLGAIYLTRRDNKDAKAGNINVALAQTDGEFITIFDTDHTPQPEFLDRVLGHFQDPQVGFVQVMLSHSNQQESWVARAAAEQTYDAFGPTFMGMHGCDGATVIGSNTTFRRIALTDIGNYKPGLAEDLHTSVHMHARGWRSVYIPEVLAQGLVPGDLAAFFKQQLKWSRGVFEILLEKYPSLIKKFTPKQHLCYLTRMTYYLAGPAVAVNNLFLILYLFFGSTIIRADFTKYLLYWLPFLCMILLIRQMANTCWRPDPTATSVQWRGTLLVYGTWPIYTIAFICALLRIKIPFIATPKERWGGNYIHLIIPQIVGVSLLLGSIGWRITNEATAADGVMIAFALLNVILHSGVFYAVWEGYQLKSKSRTSIEFRTTPF